VYNGCCAGLHNVAARKNFCNSSAILFSIRLIILFFGAKHTPDFENKIYHTDLLSSYFCLFLHKFISCCSTFRIHLPHPNKFFKFCALHFHMFRSPIYLFSSLRISPTQNRLKGLLQEINNILLSCTCALQAHVYLFDTNTQCHKNATDCVIKCTCICVYFNSLTL
jgi:hypothetical protein